MLLIDTAFVLIQNVTFAHRKKSLVCYVVWNGYCTFMTKEQNLFSCSDYLITTILSVNSCCKTPCLEIEELNFHYGVSSIISKEV